MFQAVDSCIYWVCITPSSSTALTCSWLSRVSMASLSKSTLTDEKPLMILYSCPILPPWSLACSFTLEHSVSRSPEEEEAGNPRQLDLRGDLIVGGILLARNLKTLSAIRFDMFA
ncbi:hypothetical protein LIA77_06946 [Sarocladium implicatum]|nr:hypothetical protein LIA77_06946 [Sarocladium implicatum]